MLLIALPVALDVPPRTSDGQLREQLSLTLRYAFPEFIIHGFVIVFIFHKIDLHVDCHGEFRND